MAQEEVYGTRDRSYSAWHRRESTKRFVGIEKAQLLSMIDLDASLYVEYDDRTKEPLALIETAMDVGQDHKTATVTQNLARRCKEPALPAFVLLYTLATGNNPADSKHKDIEKFRVRRLWPNPTTQWTSMLPADWAKYLLNLRGWASGEIDKKFSGRE